MTLRDMQIIVTSNKNKLQMLLNIPLTAFGSAYVLPPEVQPSNDCASPTSITLSSMNQVCVMSNVSIRIFEGFAGELYQIPEEYRDREILATNMFFDELVIRI